VSARVLKGFVMSKKRTRLTLEELEDRTQPSMFGVAWPNPGHLTLSFVPDGTAVDGSSNNLFQTLNGVASTKTWETEILRAVQNWAVNSNITIAVVPDSGDPLGAPGLLQGDPRFGDIRVAA
jgi:hypothetical protein